MISKKLFDKVQKVLKKRSNNTRFKNRLKPYSYRSLMICGECGYSITAEKKTKFYKTLGKTQEFLYYRCTKKSRTYKCQQLFIKEEKLTKQINRRLRKVSLSQDWSDRMLAMLKTEKKT